MVDPLRRCNTPSGGESPGKTCANVNASSGAAIVMLLDHAGVVTSAGGQEAVTILGRTAADYVGQSTLDLFGDDSKTKRKIARALGGEAVSLEITHRGTTAELRLFPLKDRNGETISLSGVLCDATHTRALEGALQGEKTLLEQMLSVHERDRKLLAYEIHDGLVQEATGARLQLQSLLESQHVASAVAKERIQLASDMMAAAVREARQLISGLRPPVLDERGVVPAIHYMIENRSSGIGGPRISFTTHVQFDRLDTQLENTIYRIAQEALTNAIRYSESDRVEIRLRQLHDVAELEIEDWGIGFNPMRVSKDRYGLLGIKERARLLHGRAEIYSSPGKGTRVRVKLPITEAHEKTSIINEGSIE